MTRTLKLTIEYDGTDFSGWQVQPGRRTVQGVLAAACATILRHECAPPPVGAGRTDAGVHARGQVATLATLSALPCARILRGLNGVLPEDVSVVAAEDAPEGFDARFSAKGKWYRYTIHQGEPPRALLRRTSAHVHFALDAARMRAAASALVGTHDFRGFAREADERSTVRTLFSVDVTAAGSIIEVDVKGDAFLYNMVRAIAGTLMDVGRGKRPVGACEAVLAAKDRASAGPTAPARGLCLMEVFY
jgi:tRNA pseudouridine38-40 synthase